MCCNDITLYCNSVSDDSRDAFNEIHLCLVADAGQISVHCLTFTTSC